MFPLLVSFAAAAPLDVLEAEGCLACHRDAPGVGPPLARLHEAVARNDAGWLLRALTTPDAEVAEGYSPGIMPAVTDAARAQALVAALGELGASEPPPSAPRGSLALLVIGAVGFTAGHLLLSMRGVRDRIGARLGPYGYVGVYSLVITAFFVLLLWAWSRAPYVELWPPLRWTRFVPLLVMPLVLVAQVAGYSTPTPTMSGQAESLARHPSPRGIHRITRHPVNLSAALWALAHLVPNGDVANGILMGSIFVLGVAGSVHIDRRLAAAWPEAWRAYAAQTSFLPFAAILEGRTRFSLREIGAPRILSGLALYGAILWTHEWIIGVSPWP